MCEEFCSAGGVDTWFCQQWPNEKRVAVPELGVEHMPSKSLGENWNGLEQQEGKWRQLGILTTRGFATFLQMTQLPEQIKLTDTLYGQSIIIDAAKVNSYVRIVPEGLEFMGKPLSHAHIHVAYKA
jgi:hypothetical protein